MTQPLFAYAGPVYVFTGTGGSGTDPEFLGTGEESPDIDFIPVLEPVYNDIAGARPMDRQDHGEEGVVTVVVNRWDEAVYQRCLRRSGTLGQRTRAEQGAYLVQNGRAFRLFLAFPLGGGGNAALTTTGLHTPDANNTAQGMPAGYRFFAAAIERHKKVRSGTRNNALLLQLRCMNVYQYQSTGLPNYRGHNLYDQDLSGLPANIA